MPFMPNRALAAVALIALSVSAPRAQDGMARDIEWKIRREATESSRLMKTLQVLTDVYGPRVTGSPGQNAFTVQPRVTLAFFAHRASGQKIAPAGTSGKGLGPLQGSARTGPLATPATRNASRTSDRFMKAS